MAESSLKRTKTEEGGAPQILKVLGRFLLTIQEPANDRCFVKEDYDASAPDFISFGRDSEKNTISVPEDVSISRTHFKLFLEGDKVWLEDFSSNGTFHSGRKLRQEKVELDGSTRSFFVMIKNPQSGLREKLTFTLNEVEGEDVVESVHTVPESFSLPLEEERPHTPKIGDEEKTSAYLKLVNDFPTKSDSQIQKVLEMADYELETARCILLASDPSPPLKREDSEDSISRKMIRLPHDVILFKELLDDSEQLSIVSVCIDLFKEKTAKAGAYNNAFQQQTM
jgi:hypothetical protein